MVDARGNYRIKDYSREYLLSHGFKYVKSSNSDELDRYTYRFPVYKYRNKMNLIFCKLIVDTSGKVAIEITQHDGCIFHHYYNAEYGDCTEITDKIDAVILREFKKFGIEAV